MQTSATCPECLEQKLSPVLPQVARHSSAKTFHSLLHFSHASIVEADAKTPGRGIGTMVWEYAYQQYTSMPLYPLV